MAEEDTPEKATTPMWIKCMIGVFGFAITVGVIAMSGGERVGAHTAQVDSHEKRITANTRDIKGNTVLIRDEKEQRLIIQGTINNTADDVKEIKEDFKGIQRYLMQYDFEKKKEP